jgi:hypothetical protein
VAAAGRANKPDAFTRDFNRALADEKKLKAQIATL